MISVDQALARAFELVSPMPVEIVPLAQAAGRVLAETVEARRDQPPFPSSAMDGYALQSTDAVAGQTLAVIGESAAGHRFSGTVGPGQAIRIFTGAPVPDGADRIIIQEDVTREGDKITLSDDLDRATYIRPAGSDFSAGTEIPAPRRLNANDIALLASMNIPDVPVYRKPLVALVATGNELVMPGEDPGRDQIIASNNFGLQALANSEGADARLMPIARDTKASLKTVFSLAANADLIVTIGGASVGNHDLVGSVADELGMEQSFYKVAMRPGKPLMAGRLGRSAVLGLPGNPVSSMVCGHVFMVPMLRAMQGLGTNAAKRQRATLAASLSANGAREHYMRAHHADGAITAFDRQDSSLLSVLTESNALLIRMPNDPARKAGETVDYISL